MSKCGLCSDLGRQQAHRGRAASGDGADRWVGISPAAAASYPTLITSPPGSGGGQPHRSLATGANYQKDFLLVSQNVMGRPVDQWKSLNSSGCPAHSQSAGGACAGGQGSVQGGRGAGAAAAKRLGSVETAVLAPCSSSHRRRRGSGRLLSFSAAKARSCSGSARGGARGAAR